MHKYPRFTEEGNFNIYFNIQIYVKNEKLRVKYN